VPTDTWSQRLDALLSALADADGDAAALRSFLFGIYDLLQGGDVSVQNAFEDLAEDELTAELRELAENLSAGRYDQPGNLVNFRGQVLHAARLLRGLEAALIGLGELGRSPRRIEDLAVRYGPVEGWLLPFPPRFRGEPRDLPRYFPKRALTRLRCLHSKLPNGMRLDLRLTDAAFGRDISAAACLFESLHLSDQVGARITNTSVGPFVVAGIDDRDPNAIEAAIISCCAPDEAADIVVFPELSIRPDDQRTIARLLGERPWDRSLSGPRPKLILAGSWHELDEGGALRNRAPVYDAGGTLLGHHSKHMIYGANQEHGWLRENIVPSEEILVLVSRSLTVAIAICLDFCQVARVNPYQDLDVDLVLVTSLAGEKTTVQHAAQAEALWNRRKTGTFLAQQDDSGPYGVSGAKPSEPLSEGPTAGGREAQAGFAEPSMAPVRVRKISRPG
jgi:hypothetical protein